MSPCQLFLRISPVCLGGLDVGALRRLVAGDQQDDQGPPPLAVIKSGSLVRAPSTSTPALLRLPARAIRSCHSRPAPVGQRPCRSPPGSIPPVDRAIPRPAPCRHRSRKTQSCAAWLPSCACSYLLSSLAGTVPSRMIFSTVSGRKRMERPIRTYSTLRRQIHCRTVDGFIPTAAANSSVFINFSGILWNTLDYYGILWNYALWDLFLASQTMRTRKWRPGRAPKN